ncbi:chorion transcription factor Cf2 isoform X5 [Pieris rapae]|uniref:chorion transcription factor Cf2 isoform X5 n=1 Tax=Pieris rapae TaxID=64459 RepID=UPI001E281478|nr:chorion transcription factor Cf2 isoform X5 [Pieris rapae]
MCDMQNMPAQDDGSCEEDSEMNWNATFQAMGGGTHFVTTGGQLPVTKIQQNPNNGTQLSQVVGMVGGVNMGEGVQYVRTLDGTQLQTTPQVISVPITLPGTKPGDPQQTVQIQVLAPSLIQQPQPKYQMQIPIQGFQQGGAVLTVAYSPDANDNGIQLLGNGMSDGLQVVAALPQDMQLVQDNKDQMQQMYLTQNQQIVINNQEDVKPIINTSNNNNEGDIVIKEEECDDEDSQSTQNSDRPQDIYMSHPDLMKYVYSIPGQQAQGLPVSLQQFLRLNPIEAKKNVEKMETEITITPENTSEPVVNDEILSEDTRTKKKKKYKKKPTRPARPKPGQVIIATASDGSPIYCCPECQNAYPEKEQLEMHLSVHQIERRFICGICGAGLKRKEHLERHKLGHNPERPYVCSVCGKGFKRREHLNLHVVIHSGVKSERCGECGKGFYRKDHLRKHTRSHETKRAKDEAKGEGNSEMFEQEAVSVSPGNGNTVLPEITIHVPTSANMQIPIQINIPQHVMSSLAAAQRSGSNGGNGASGTVGNSANVNSGPICTEAQLDAILAQHT